MSDRTLRVTVLGSGSRGNAVLVEGSIGSVVIDAGFGVRAMARRFSQALRTPESVHDLLLTHEHVDHASGAAAASKRWNWTVHGTAATLAALDTIPGGAPERVASISATSGTSIAGFEVEHHAVPHDAADCRAFRLTDTRSGARVAIVLDCGDVPETLPAFLSHVDLLVMESNHDRAMLQQGPYPWQLKKRISGGRGHLSNDRAAALLATSAHHGLQGVLLAHLSETNNTPSHAIDTARDALRRAGWRKDLLWACAQREPIECVDALGRSGHARATQLALF
ncbi:MAG: MBL fold metallo-hydrolase [Gemmatimonadaceae bacterium]|nr:MBL fold metallo-hydrolase [Gemmatimonadaceae bacterium]